MIRCCVGDKTGFYSAVVGIWRRHYADYRRRFGKTLNLSMLNCFFPCSMKIVRIYLRRLKVWEEKSYHKLQGRFPSYISVISGC